jgi:hypothetical protein
MRRAKKPTVVKIDDEIFEYYGRKQRSIENIALESKICFDIGDRRKAFNQFMTLNELELTTLQKSYFAKVAFNYAKVRHEHRLRWGYPGVGDTHKVYCDIFTISHQ